MKITGIAAQWPLPGERFNQLDELDRCGRVGRKATLIAHTPADGHRDSQEDCAALIRAALIRGDRRRAVARSPG
jgi:hypothetical protein